MDFPDMNTPVFPRSIAMRQMRYVVMRASDVMCALVHPNDADGYLARDWNTEALARLLALGYEWIRTDNVGGNPMCVFAREARDIGPRSLQVPEAEREEWLWRDIFHPLPVCVSPCETSSPQSAGAGSDAGTTPSSGGTSST